MELKSLRSAWLSGALVAALVAAALWWPGAGELRTRAAALPAAAWIGALVGLGASYALRALRLQDEWRLLPLCWSTALAIALVHSAAINLLPLRAGEAGYPWLLHRRCGVALADAGASLLWLRAQDAAVIALLMGVALGPAAEAPWRAAFALAAACALAWGLPAGARWALGRWPGGDRAQGPVARLLPVLLRAAARARARSWLWSGLNWIVKIGALALLLAPLARVPWLGAARGALFGEAAAALPVQAPAGFGTYEAAVWLGLQVPAGAGPEATTALGAALIAHLFVLLTSAAGAALVAGSLVARVGVRDAAHRGPSR